MSHTQDPPPEEESGQVSILMLFQVFLFFLMNFGTLFEKKTYTCRMSDLSLPFSMGSF
jgi:hypothetical protein